MGAGFGFGSAVSMFVVVLLCGGLYGCPEYNVYQSKMAGEAELAQSEASKQVQVSTARGKLEAATLLAGADVERAKGVSQANEILQKQLGGPENYLRWKYIEMLEATASEPGKTVIYVPTEANLPILEAGRATVK